MNGRGDATGAGRNTLSTHVLDTSRGVPAAGIAVTLERVSDDGTVRQIGGGVTDQDGRLRDLVRSGEQLAAGAYRLRFATGAYFARSGHRSFFPEVAIQFMLDEQGEHYHVPLLASPFGYTTYRGS